jgi:hypothetical protein
MNDKTIRMNPIAANTKLNTPRLFFATFFHKMYRISMYQKDGSNKIEILVFSASYTILDLMVFLTPEDLDSTFCQRNCGSLKSLNIGILIQIRTK